MVILGSHILISFFITTYFCKLNLGTNKTVVFVVCRFPVVHKPKKGSKGKYCEGHVETRIVFFTCSFVRLL